MQTAIFEWTGIFDVVGTDKNLTAPAFPKASSVLGDKELIEQINANPDFSPNTCFEDKKEEKLSLIDTREGKIYPRNEAKSKDAIARAKYKCEYDGTHLSFRRKTPPYLAYTEPHHLVPIENHNDFEYSLDVEANICSLCSTCHNCLHYGIAEDRNPILEKLFKERQERLAKAGLVISFDALEKYY